MSSNRRVKELTQEQIGGIIRDYQNPVLSTRDVCRRNGVGKDKMMQVVREHKITPRGRHSRTFVFRGRIKREMGEAIASAYNPFNDVALERAKLTLRKRGHVVFAAEVTDGGRARGFFRCDGKLWTREQVMEAAAK